MLAIFVVEIELPKEMIKVADFINNQEILFLLQVLCVRKRGNIMFNEQNNH